jgi:hypothetical protein
MCCHSVPGLGHRRQHRHLHPDGPAHASSVADPQSRTTGGPVSDRQPQREQHGPLDAFLSDLSGLPAERRAPLRSPLPPPEFRLHQRRQPDGASGDGDGLRQLLHHVGREARPRPPLHFRRGRSHCPGPPRSDVELPVLGEPLRQGPERDRQEDSGEQLPDDHRGRLRARIRGSRPGPGRADPGADSDEGSGDAGMVVVQRRIPPVPLGPGVRAFEAGIPRWWS